MKNPFLIFDQLRQAYLRYLDSPFRLRYPALMEERRALLDQDRQLYREPLFEPVVPYESSEMTVRGACSQLGVSPQVAEYLEAGGLFPAERELFQHQLEVWGASRQGDAVIVTTGTGSGKTECYLLPVFAYLVEESARWGAPSGRHPNYLWWSHPRQQRIPQRAHETGRPRAMRALFLYPLNALIEDQLSRIRRACDSPDGRLWLTNQRAGNTFWFGRYTGSTPVSGPKTIPTKQQDLRRRLQMMADEWDRAMISASQSGKYDILAYFQDPHGSEMWSRWDMQEAPPDILITNYSMLNIMLMRGLENEVFEQTRRWLAEDRERNLFHLIVDELHTYRGTPGTEVGYLLRALLHRLDLTPDSPQLRIIATSASINPNDTKSIQYLEQFFGRDPSTFTVVGGKRVTFPGGRDDLSAQPFVDFGHALDTVSLDAAIDTLTAQSGISTNQQKLELRLGEVLANLGVLERVRCEGEREPFTSKKLGESLFGTDPNGVAAARAVMRALVIARQKRGKEEVAPLPLRAHYFFHNAGRLWVCLNPQCSGRRGITPPDADNPPVGCLYIEPRPRCEYCSARVLELLYCQPCGEVFLGGYRDADFQSNKAWFLSPDFPDLEHVPDRSASLERNHGEYLVFWPACGRELAHNTHAGPSWRWQQDGDPDFQWCPASLDVIDGRLALGFRSKDSTQIAGYTFIAPVNETNAFPAKCPHCGADWGRRRGVKSPIRDLGSGFQRIMQLLGDALVRQMSDASKKLVLFSDSRLDAAKLSTGIKLAHYRDTLRQVAFSALNTVGVVREQEYRRDYRVYCQAVELQGLLSKQEAEGLSREENARRKELMSNLPVDVVGELTKYEAAGGPPPAALTPPAPLGSLLFMPFQQVLGVVRIKLLSLGMNPGGPLPSVAEFKPNRNGPRIWWTDLVDWSQIPPHYREDLQPLEERLQARMETSLRENIISSVLFASGARDFESLGLGYLWISSTSPSNTVEHAAASVVRILAQKWRWIGTDNQGQSQAPLLVRSYLACIASDLGMKVNDLQQDVESMLGSSLKQWLVDPESMVVVSPRPSDQGTIDVYKCRRCGCLHLHPSGGFCIVCRAPLSSIPERHDTTSDPTDYYEYLGRCPDLPFRLNCEELTGQTDRIERRLRQRRFQEVFMADEVEIASGVDLLSVTTTMEAGVDIGALQAIALANMPPTRFNYQQRVGRAGRRGLGFSAALTLCRGRSHDDYYFERPRLITAEPPPRPYVDVSRPEIARRVINKEVLKRAFEYLDLPHSADNVHGDFGSVSDWATYRAQVVDWTRANRRAVEEICGAILRRTALTSAATSMVEHVEGDLIRLIDDIARKSQAHNALSERLASHGVLPMFGFPTRVRYLYHGGWPHSDGGWPPERGVVDRQLDIAISQFAPGAQTVKDDQLLTSVGVVDYYLSKGRVVTAPNPLGNPVSVGICRRCQALIDDPVLTGGCPYCKAPRGKGDYRTVALSEPPGFMTWFAGEAEYNGAFEFTPRALRARMGRTPGSPDQRRNFEIECGLARIHRINDNSGEDFTFKKIEAGHIWIVDAALQRALQDLPADRQRSVSRPRYETPELTLTRALASITSTDVLVVGIPSVPGGITLNPAKPEARAAWYSFGFLARRVAAVVLDVAENELDIGIQPVMDMSTPFAPPSARIFMSDSLENGAGYSTYLGSPTEFEDLLRFMIGQGGRTSNEFYDFVVSEADDAGNPGHARECSSSCHRCLRDYSNMPYHPLLDWRLALDMARLALDASAPIDLTSPYWDNLVQRTVPAYLHELNYRHITLAGLPVGQDPYNNEALILIHPLWDQDPANFRPEVAAAVSEASARGWRWTLRTLFRAVRFPYA